MKILLLLGLSFVVFANTSQACLRNKLGSEICVGDRVIDLYKGVMV